MTTRVTHDPRGREWRVRRRWIPRREGVGVAARVRRRRSKAAGSEQRKRDWSGIDAIPDLGDGGPAELVAGLVLVVVILVIVFFGPTVLLLGIDLAWFVTVFTAGVFARFVLRTPWRVEAHSTADGHHHDEAVSGFRAAGRRRDEIADDIAAGLLVVPD